MKRFELVLAYSAPFDVHAWPDGRVSLLPPPADQPVATRRRAHSFDLIAEDETQAVAIFREATGIGLLSVAARELATVDAPASAAPFFYPGERPAPPKPAEAPPPPDDAAELARKAEGAQAHRAFLLAKAADARRFGQTAEVTALEAEAAKIPAAGP